MERWRCPKCDREFGRRNQGHMCNPGLTLEEYFATAKPWEEPIFQVVSDHLHTLGDLIVDPLQMGIMFKNGPMLCELRAKTKWTALGFSLRRKLDSGRLSRKVVDYKSKYFHVINLTSPDEIDDEILGWLTEAYHVAGGALTAPPTATRGDPMVPDDLDEDDYL
ncbi:MAG: DUF5655 domain-containing protein [Actinomycetota bacterium]